MAGLTRTSGLVIVSNRLPMRRTSDARAVGKGEGEQWTPSPGGLVSALRPVIERAECTWVGWLGDCDEAPDPFEAGGIHAWPIHLSREDHDRYYEGFSNGTLWPLYHDAIRPPEFHRSWWRSYVQVNERFAERAAEAAGDGGTVWVHDYQLQLVPAMLRARRPDLRIGFFLHIPFPPTELFAQLPWRQTILEGMLGSDVIGFQTTKGARNFAELCRRYAGASGARQTLDHGGRRVQIEAFPISIDTAHYGERARSDEVAERRKELEERLALMGRRVMLGVDRLDYTKGIDTRLRAFRELLRSGRITPDEWVLLQVAVPSRDGVDEYQRLRESVERLVGEINGEFGEFGRMPVQYLHRSVDSADLVALYTIADIMLVTPLRDGMNLVAKEYVAARVDVDGVLLLSEFAGAARELDSAVIVNPHDLDGLADSIARAADMPHDEQHQRMRTMRRQVKRHDVFAWSNGFMAALQG